MRRVDALHRLGNRLVDWTAALDAVADKALTFCRLGVNAGRTHLPHNLGFVRAVGRMSLRLSEGDLSALGLFGKLILVLAVLCRDNGRPLNGVKVHIIKSFALGMLRDQRLPCGGSGRSRRQVGNGKRALPEIVSVLPLRLLVRPLRLPDLQSKRGVAG